MYLIPIEKCYHAHSQYTDSLISIQLVKQDEAVAFEFKATNYAFLLSGNALVCVWKRALGMKKPQASRLAKVGCSHAPHKSLTFSLARQKCQHLPQVSIPAPYNDIKSL